MALETQLGELFKEDTIDSMKILDSLLSPKNLDMKTDIISPLKFATLEAIVDNIQFLLAELDKQKLKLPMTEKLLKKLIYKIKLLMVSHVRKSRTEITETLKSIRQEGSTERSFFQKMLGLNR